MNLEFFILFDCVLIEILNGRPKDRKKREQHHQDQNDEQKVFQWTQTAKWTFLHFSTPRVVRY